MDFEHKPESRSTCPKYSYIALNNLEATAAYGGLQNRLWDEVWISHPRRMRLFNMYPVPIISTAARRIATSLKHRQIQRDPALTTIYNLSDVNSQEGQRIFRDEAADLVAEGIHRMAIYGHPLLGEELQNVAKELSQQLDQQQAKLP